MSDNNLIDYGPLQPIIGTWKGDRGIDIAPKPDGSANIPFYETIIFTAIGDVSNAKTQKLAAVHYRQIVRQKLDDEVFHDETGYWMWVQKSELVMHSLTIPRGVCLLAGGEHNGKAESDGSIVLNVAANIESADWQIIQQPFMRDNARTTAFKHRIIITETKLIYSETTTLEIYGKTFLHTDENELLRQ